MTGLQIILDGDGAFKDVDEKIKHEGELERVAMLQMGTSGGRPSVGFLIKLPNGEYVFAQTTLRLFCTAAKTMQARYELVLEGHT